MHLPASRHARLAVAVLSAAVAVLGVHPATTMAAGSGATATALAADATTSPYSAAVTLTATVTATDGGVPGGTVSFEDGGAVVGTIPVGSSAGGVATYTTSLLSTGTHTLTAIYGGDATHASSRSDPTDHTVQPMPATLQLTSGANPSAPHQEVSLSATVVPQVWPLSVAFTVDPGSPYAGTNGDTTLTPELGNMFLGGGTSTLAMHATDSRGNQWVVGLQSRQGDGTLHVGRYDGAAANQTVTSPGLSITGGGWSCSTTTGDFTINEIEYDANGSIRGVDAGFDQYCAGVSGGLHGHLHAAATPPTQGSATIREGSTVLGTGNIGYRSSLTIQTSSLGLGDHALTAEYAGDTGYAGGETASLTQHVVGASSAIALYSSANPSSSGQPVRFSATVTTSPGTAPAGGSVTLYDGPTALGTASVDQGHANFSPPALTGGSHALVARYGGDGVNPPADSPTLNQTVSASTVSITLAASVNPTVPGQPLTLTATVSLPQDWRSATGTITISDADVVLGTGSLAQGNRVEVQVPSLGARDHPLTAAYGGDGTYGPASASLIEVVAPPVEILVSPITDPSVPGQRFALAVTVLAPDGGVPSGSINVWEGARYFSRYLASGSLDAGGQAVVVVPGLYPASQQVLVSYAGDGTYATADVTFTQSIVAAAPNRRFVNQLYNDILGRAGDAGAAAWATELDRHRVDRTHVALALTSSDEYLTGQVQATYLAHLGREADPPGLAFWVGYIHRGATFEDLEISFLGTPEYYRGSGNTDDTFLTALYADVFGRDIDPGGRTYWDGRLAHGAPAWLVAASVVRSHEAMSNRVTDDYRLLLGRDPDPGGRDSWTALLQQGTRDEALLAQLAGSDEYWNLTQAY